MTGDAAGCELRWFGEAMRAPRGAVDLDRDPLTGRSSAVRIGHCRTLQQDPRRRDAGAVIGQQGQEARLMFYTVRCAGCVAPDGAPNPRFDPLAGDWQARSEGRTAEQC